MEPRGRLTHFPQVLSWRAVGPLAPLPPSFYRRPAEAVARDLLGRYLVREVEGETLVLRLVEVEAYLGAPDRASHAWGGRRTPRNASLYLPGGTPTSTSSMACTGASTP